MPFYVSFFLLSSLLHSPWPCLLCRLHLTMKQLVSFFAVNERVVNCCLVTLSLSSRFSFQLSPGARLNTYDYFLWSHSNSIHREKKQTDSEIRETIIFHGDLSTKQCASLIVAKISGKCKLRKSLQLLCYSFLTLSRSLSIMFSLNLLQHHARQSVA